MDQQLSFTTTGDGSRTLFHPEVGEHYHSRHGALQESRHVFLNTGLRHFLGDAKKAVSILEVGFGTGLNFLLTADYCLAEGVQLDYTGIEPFPLPQDIIQETGYAEYVAPAIWTSFQVNYPEALSNTVRFDQYTHLTIDTRKLLDFNSEKQFDVMYFDAFAAIHQPEMWNEEALTHITSFLGEGAVFVTYAITGHLKRTLTSLGFRIEKAPGAPGKREMLRATKT